MNLVLLKHLLEDLKCPDKAENGESCKLVVGLLVAW